ncbi:hypothetical protein LPW26_12490 [Rhodopseudomonas sp. HC1]|uniref:hypothetical protein n=1 Tax=Rhodopseudomonas infernalis TaxID=2897386 RepID=UPI001EE8D1FC|nr:hypothetical protein [Rhodopseudomonas infernalis]MCG6205461.1 hypothetical protein [Rhodopseudomonas infernalis]
MRPKPITLLLATPLICASALAAILPTSAQQSPPQQPQAQQIPADATRPGNPRLADLMEATQARHIKLWFAGVTANWKLAAYQTRQIKARLQEAASLYDSLPVSDVTTMAKPIDAVTAAIAAQDSKAFVKAYGELTAGCNSCHRELKLGFIELKTPEMNPFADQVFGVRKK